MIVRILQKIVYPTFKNLARLVFFFYYEKITIVHPERLNFKGPTLLVSNHPNTLLDPLNVGIHIPRRIHFLANASLFNSMIGNWFFSTFYCIRIERASDVNGKRIENKESFARCDEFLAGGGCIYVAPQGGSEMVRRLGKLKTGTARIGLSAASKNDFNLGLKIVPVGLNYSDPASFRGQVLVHAGEPIFIRDYKEIYSPEDFSAVKKLTADLEERMSNLIIDTEDEQEDQLLTTLETIARTDRNHQPKEAYIYAQNMLSKIKITRQNDLVKFEELCEQANIYTKKLRRLQLVDAVVSKTAVSVGDLFFLLVTCPFFLYGWINNFLAAYLPALAAKKSGLYIGYTSTVKTLLGIITFPLFYFLQSFLLAWIGVPNWALIIYLVSLPIFGLFAWEYMKKQELWRAQMAMNRLKTKAPRAVEDLKALRKTLRDFGH